MTSKHPEIANLISLWSHVLRENMRDVLFLDVFNQENFKYTPEIDFHMANFLSDPRSRWNIKCWCPICFQKLDSKTRDELFLNGSKVITQVDVIIPDVTSRILDSGKLSALAWTEHFIGPWNRKIHPATECENMAVRKSEITHLRHKWWLLRHV